MATYIRLSVYFAVFLALFLSGEAFSQGLKGLAAGDSVGAQLSSNISNDSSALNPGDEIKVVVLDEEALSGSFDINRQGYIKFPLVGEVMVEGLTASQVADLLTSKLADGYLKKPRVYVEASLRQEVYILGAVSVPGGYVFRSGMTFLDLIEMAGGFAQNADESSVQILRPQEQKPDIYRVFPVDSVVEPHDIVLVKEK